MRFPEIYSEYRLRLTVESNGFLKDSLLLNQKKLTSAFY